LAVSDWFKISKGDLTVTVYTAAVIPSQVQQHIEVLLSELETKMLVVGNINKDEAITLAKMTEETIPASPLPGICPVDLSLELPEGLS
jgi:insulysin